MPRSRKIWSDQEILNEISKYKSDKEVRKNCETAKVLAKRRGLWEIASAHFTGEYPKITKEECISLSRQFSTRKEFRTAYPKAYNTSLKNGWSEVFDGLVVCGSRFKRAVYQYSFPDGAVYVGLTYNIKTRDINHLNSIQSPVFIHKRDTGLSPKLEQLTDYIELEMATKAEREAIQKNLIDGKIVLNSRLNGGQTGCGKTSQWTREICEKEAREVKNSNQFRVKSKSMYMKAYRTGWLKEFQKNIWKTD